MVPIPSFRDIQVVNLSHNRELQSRRRFLSVEASDRHILVRSSCFSGVLGLFATCEKDRVDGLWGIQTVKQASWILLLSLVIGYGQSEDAAFAARYEAPVVDRALFGDDVMLAAERRSYATNLATYVGRPFKCPPNPCPCSAPREAQQAGHGSQFSIEAGCDAQGEGW